MLAWLRSDGRRATQQRRRVTRRGPIRDRERDRDTHSPEQEIKSKTCNARRTQCGTHASKQASKQAKAAAAENCRNCRRYRSCRNCNCGQWRGAVSIPGVVVWSCPAPRLTVLSGPDRKVWVWCFCADGVPCTVWCGQKSGRRNGLRFGFAAVHVPGLRKRRQASDGWWPLWKNPGTGPVLFTFRSCAAGLLGCIRPWPFTFIWRQQTSGKVWRTEHLPWPAIPSSASLLLLLCRQPGRGHPMNPTNPNKAIQRHRAVPPAHHLPGPPAAPLCLLFSILCKPQKGQKIQAPTRRPGKAHAEAQDPELGPPQLAVLQSGTQF